MLDSAHAKQLAGDAWGRCFRPVDSLGRELQDDDRVLEGYHWGQFTSGSWKQGLWLILIPFGFVNAAMFMVPDPGKKASVRFWHGVVAGLIRGIGVGLTCTFALAAGLILVDLLAWQAAAGLPWLARVPNGYVLAAGVLAATALMFGLHNLGNQKRERFAPEDAPGSIAERTHVGLSRRAFYSGDPDAPTLGRLHLTAGCSVVALIGVLTARSVDSDVSLDSLLWVTATLVVLVNATTVVLGDPDASATGTKRHDRWHRQIMERWSWFLLGASLFYVAAAAWRLAGTDQPPVSLNFDDYSRLLAGAMILVLIVLSFANAVLAALTRDQHRDTPKPFRRYAGGMAPWAAAATGLFLGVGFCGAFVLGTARTVGVRAQTDLIYRVSYAWGLTACLLLGIVICGLVFYWRTKARLLTEADASFSKVLPRTLPDGWLPRVAGASAVARVKNLIPWVVMTTAIGGSLMTYVTAHEMLLGDIDNPFGLLSGVQADGGVARLLINVGTYTLIGLAGLLFFLGRRALRTQDARRGANVVWDVVSFWPHSAHPFVPPAYSQFAVRELRNRILFHLGRLDAQPEQGPAQEVVVAAHSQGSLIAFAAMLWLSDEDAKRVGLLTFGSQLQVAFPRAFTAYVNVGLISAVYDQLDGRWVNLYRETDPIAGPVLSWKRTSMVGSAQRSCSIGADGPQADDLDQATGRRESGNDWRLLDPVPADPQRQLGAVVRMSRHSGFPGSADYAAALTRVRPSSAPRPST